MRNINHLKIVVSGWVLIFLLSSGIAMGDEYTVRFTITEITSEETADKVASILKGINGVFDVETNVLRHTATFTYEDDDTETDEIERVLKKGGFSVKRINILREPQKKE